MNHLQGRVATKRISRDIQQLLSHDFTSSSATLLASDVLDYDSGSTGQRLPPQRLHYIYKIPISVCIHEGPYRGGHFLFFINIPEDYPFQSVSVTVNQSRPLWHPNVDMASGKVLLPLQWSPVLTLTSVAVALQMLLLEPSADNPLNLEASHYYSTDSASFDHYSQQILHGYSSGDRHFVNMSTLQCEVCKHKNHQLRHHNADEEGSSKRVMQVLHRHKLKTGGSPVGSDAIAANAGIRADVHRSMHANATKVLRGSDMCSMFVGHTSNRRRNGSCDMSQDNDSEKTAEEENSEGLDSMLEASPPRRKVHGRGSGSVVNDRTEPSFHSFASQSSGRGSKRSYSSMALDCRDGNGSLDFISKESGNESDLALDFPESWAVRRALTLSSSPAPPPHGNNNNFAVSHSPINVPVQEYSLGSSYAVGLPGTVNMGIQSSAEHMQVSADHSKVIDGRVDKRIKRSP